MYPSKFQYIEAESSEAAVALLEENPNAKILAGGQSLVPLQKTRLATPPTVIDINGLSSLEYITPCDDEIRTGAVTRHTSLQTSPHIRAHLYLFSECINQIADWQVRNQGTIGGTIVEADPDGDYLPVMELLNPEFVILGPGGERTTSFEDFFLGMFSVDLDHAEILTEVRLPKLERGPAAGGIGSTYVKHAERSGDYAMVGIAAIIAVNGNGAIVNGDLSVGAVGPVTNVSDTLDPLIDDTLEENTLESVVEDISETIEPDENSPHKRMLTREVAKTAIETAYDRAVDEGDVDE